LGGCGSGGGGGARRAWGVPRKAFAGAQPPSGPEQQHQQQQQQQQARGVRALVVRAAAATAAGARVARAAGAAGAVSSGSAPQPASWPDLPPSPPPDLPRLASLAKAPAFEPRDHVTRVMPQPRPSPERSAPPSSEPSQARHGPLPLPPLPALPPTGPRLPHIGPLLLFISTAPAPGTSASFGERGGCGRGMPPRPPARPEESGVVGSGCRSLRPSVFPKHFHSPTRAQTHLTHPSPPFLHECRPLPPPRPRRRAHLLPPSTLQVLYPGRSFVEPDTRHPTPTPTARALPSHTRCCPLFRERGPCAREHIKP
jgi:hypothetical protein